MNFVPQLREAQNAVCDIELGFDVSKFIFPFSQVHHI